MEQPKISNLCSTDTHQEPPCQYPTCIQHAWTRLDTRSMHIQSSTCGQRAGHTGDSQIEMEIWRSRRRGYGAVEDVGEGGGGDAMCEVGGGEVGVANGEDGMAKL
ncbi:uncharacterized protein J3R85_014103 [Psidium guajava]|nr:uncharacterized protein J3R85_014103 [Psidium guajava]